MWRHRSASVFVQAMACRLTAPSHFLNQCWIIISSILWHLLERHFTLRGEATMLCYQFENNSFIITSLFPTGWWRHQMEIFSALLAICAGNSPVTGEFPSQRPVAWNFDVFFDPRLNKRLSKQSCGRWFETPSRPLWRHCNGPMSQSLWSLMTHIHIDLLGKYYLDNGTPPALCKKLNFKRSLINIIPYLPYSFHIHAVLVFC